MPAQPPHILVTGQRGLFEPLHGLIVLCKKISVLCKAACAQRWSAESIAIVAQPSLPAWPTSDPPLVIGVEGCLAASDSVNHAHAEEAL